MPEPLKRKKKDGTQYERPPEIEAFLEKLEIVESYGTASTSRNFIQNKTWLCTIRGVGLLSSGGLVDRGAKNRIREIFFRKLVLKRVEQSLCSDHRLDSRIADARGIRD